MDETIDKVLKVFDQLLKEMRKRDMRWGDGGVTGDALLDASVKIALAQKET